jgi:hypothetical protein
MMSDLTHHPSACNANASRAGIISRSLGLRPAISRLMNPMPRYALGSALALLAPIEPPEL